MPFPSPGDLPDPGIEPGSPILQADSLLSEPAEMSFDQIKSKPRVSPCRPFALCLFEISRLPQIVVDQLLGHI